MATTHPDRHPSDPGGHGDRRCVADNAQGERCKRRPIPGGAVCHLHGGGAPQVKRRAQLRLLELVDPAIATLAKELVQAEKSADRQRAANSILDRAGYGRVQKVEGADAKEILLQRLLQLRDQDTGGEHTPDGEDE